MVMTSGPLGRQNIGPSRGYELGGLEGERVSEDSNYFLRNLEKDVRINEGSDIKGGKGDVRDRNGCESVRDEDGWADADVRLHQPHKPPILSPKRAQRLAPFKLLSLPPAPPHWP